ncbi:MAG: sugar phosphate isomerase/epimerase [Spirochaetales bacterium]|nr:sugar phosphate isomerase/epimerase [Spirochaetales bacterium]
MKISVSFATFNGADASPILFMGNAERAIPTIAELGYDGVDFFSRNPSDYEERKAARMLEKNNLGVGVVMPAALAGEGLTMSDPDEAVREEFMRRIRPIIDFASDMGGMVSMGLIRGSKRPEEQDEVFFDRFADSCRRMLDMAERKNVPLVIEPINRSEINTLNSSIESYDFIRKYDLPVYLMLDTFHMFQEDDSVLRSLEVCRDYIKHIHFLDSNRLAPGMGDRDMEQIYGKIKDLGYDGYLCLEALRRPDGLTVAKKGIEFFRKIGVKRG